MFTPLFTATVKPGATTFTPSESSMDERHWSEKKVEEMTERDWSMFNEEYNISYKGSKITHPMRTWAESRLSLELLKSVEKAGYKTPSPIQMAAIPLGLQQRDVIGIAETGSGKTAAFILPMLNYISKLPIEAAAAAKGPYALVLAPGRLLAEQIEEETLKFAQYLGFKVVSIVGTGRFIEKKGIELRQGCQIVIATPRGLTDCLERRYVALNNCSYVVLYDPDFIVHMGFESHVTRIFDAMPFREEEDEEFDEKKKIYTHRTTYLFGAIMTSTVERLASKYLRNPVVVTVGKATTDFICQQHVIMMSPDDKFNSLQRLLGELNDDTAIVFVNFHPHVFLLADDLVRDGYRVTTLHLNLSQDEKEIRLEGFRTHTFNVLVATTEVFGCVIDIPDAAHVVNYDMPKNIETYIHHLGRASVATTFLTLRDKNVFYDLKLLLYKSNSHVPPELANYTVLTTRCTLPL